MFTVLKLTVINIMIMNIIMNMIIIIIISGWPWDSWCWLFRHRPPSQGLARWEKATTGADEYILMKLLKPDNEYIIHTTYLNKHNFDQHHDHQHDQLGHSCNIGNTPNLGGKKLKTAFSVFLVYFWYGLILTDIEKVRGELKIFSNTFIWQDLRFFCPRDRLAISDKITCQSLNFICQTLEKLLQFADQTYKLKKMHLLSSFP